MMAQLEFFDADSVTKGKSLEAIDRTVAPRLKRCGAQPDEPKKSSASWL